MPKSTDNYLRLDENLLVKPRSKVDLRKFDTKYTAGFKDKDDAQEMLEQDV